MLREALTAVTTEEYRVGFSRVEQQHGRRITYRECPDLETAEFIARMERRLDDDGVDGMPIANKLTVQPFIEVRTVTSWADAPAASQNTETEEGTDER